MAQEWNAFDLDRLNKPQPDTAYWREKWRQDELEWNDFVACAREGQIARNVAAEETERKQREKRFADSFEQILGGEYLAALQESLPPPEERLRLLDLYKPFQQYCRDNLVSDLPADAPVAASWLLWMDVDKIPLSKIKDMAEAILFVHRYAHEYIDDACVHATLTAIEKNRGGGGGGTLKAKHANGAGVLEEEHAPEQAIRIH